MKKKSIATMTAVLFTLSAAAPFTTAFADDGEHVNDVAKSTVSTQLGGDNWQEALQTWLNAEENHDKGGHAGNEKDKHQEKHNNGKHHDKNEKGDAQESVTTSTSGSASSTTDAAHQAQVAALHQAIDQLHKDQQAAQSAHKQLSQATHAYVETMETAFEQGNTAIVNQGVSGIQPILNTLSQALKAQQAEESSGNSSVSEGAHGNLTAAIQAVKDADARMQAKTKAMQTAVQSLNTLVASLKSGLTGSSTTTSGSTTVSGSTSSTAGNTTSTSNGSVENVGSVTITPTNSTTSSTH